MPGLAIEGPQDFDHFRWGIHLGGLTAIAIALWLWSHHRRDGAPWLVVVAINVTQLILFETLGFVPAWKGAFVAFGDIPIVAHALGATLLAAAALWSGWHSVPPRRVRPSEAAA